MKNIQRLLMMLLLICVTYSCEDYLDIVPDNVRTIDNAFSTETQARRYLVTCYSYMPRLYHPHENPGFYAGDEAWIYWPIASGFANYPDPYFIARGLQNKVDPNLNFWDGGRSFWDGIRACNTFLENIKDVPFLEPFEKRRWLAEVKFLKAYYHWYLLKSYGPIPIVDENLPIDSSSEEVKTFRRPVDEVVDYIIGLMDEVSAEDAGLPEKISKLADELGRLTRPAVLSIKARMLVTVASPLFNGNSDYSGFNGNDDVPLFNPTPDDTKWTRAAVACKEAIEACEQAGIALYLENDLLDLPDFVRTEMSIRNALCEEWNSELIWGLTGSNRNLQAEAAPNMDPSLDITTAFFAQMAPTLRMAELFYTENGVPIDEDTTWDFEGRYDLASTTAADRTLKENHQVVQLHLNREPRFYADLAFDGAKWFMRNNVTYDNAFEIESKIGEFSGKQQSIKYSITGYFIKKIVNWNLTLTNNTPPNFQRYPWPVMRLADLYLLYAEASTETGDLPTALTYLNRVRERAGLETVESSWSTYSKNPGKYTTKDGLREIVHQERLIEMAFEGSRFWDLKRWKKSAIRLNTPVFGWDVEQEDAVNYYRKTLLFEQSFIAPRDYLWPIRDRNLIVNPTLIQNPGW